MKEFIVFIGLIVSFSSFGYGFFPMPLDSPVVVNYSQAGLSTGGNWGRGTAWDSHGWIYAVYVSSSNDLVCCSRSTDNGRTWSLFAVLNDAWGLFPNIVIDKGDSIYVDWERSPVDTIGHDIYFSKYNGSSWTSPVNVSNEHGTGSNESSSLALDGRGMLHLTWLGYGPDIWYSYYTNNVWSTKENVTQGTGSWVASMCADSGTNLHLAWQGWQIMYKERSGDVWGPTEQASPIQSWGPCVATDLKLSTHVAYSDSTSRVAYVRRDSSGWSLPYYVSGDSLGGGPSITCDKYGHLYVVWVGYEARPNLWYATYDGTAWSAPARLRNDTAYGDYDPRLGFPVSDSGIDLIWTEDRAGGGYNVMYWRLPLLPVGVEDQSQKAFNVESLRLNVQSPVRRELSVSYFLPSQSKVSLILYDLSGRKVMVLDEGEKPTGRYEVRRSLGLPAGVYFLRLETGRVALTRKVVVIR